MSPFDQRTFTPREVAEFLNVKADTVLDWIHAGELAASDVSKPGSKKPRWRILEHDVQLFLEKRKKVPPPPKVRRKRRNRKPADFIEYF